MPPSDSLFVGRQKARLIDWIIHHELSLFFAFTFLFSWTIYGIVAQRSIGNNTTFSRVLLIAGYGPSLSAILLSIITKAKPTIQISIRQLMLLISVLVLVAGIELLGPCHSRTVTPTNMQVVRRGDVCTC
jgi:hypothetical protein